MFWLEVSKTNMIVRNVETLVSGAVEIYRCQFLFGLDWEGLTKTAVFSSHGIVREQLLDNDDQCVIPWEVLAVPGGSLMVGVKGEKAGDVILRPSILANLGQIHQGPAKAETAKAPTPGVYSQLLAAVQGAHAAAQALQADAAAGKFNGTNGLTPHIGPNGNWFLGDSDTGTSASGLAVQADYSQNDPEAQDYIRNRPFYEEIKHGVIFEGEVDNPYQGTATSIGIPMLSPGTTYTLEFGGNAYTSVAKTLDGMPCGYLGNGAIFGVEDTGENYFVFTGIERGKILAILLFMDAAGEMLPSPVSIKLTGDCLERVTIPEKFLPGGLQNFRFLSSEIKVDTAAGTEVRYFQPEELTNAIDSLDGCSLYIDNKLVSHAMCYNGKYTIRYAGFINNPEIYQEQMQADGSTLAVQIRGASDDQFLMLKDPDVFDRATNTRWGGLSFELDRIIVRKYDPIESSYFYPLPPFTSANGKILGVAAGKLAWLDPATAIVPAVIDALPKYDGEVAG